MKVYRIYDEEYSELAGKNQLFDFVTREVCDSSDYYEVENLEMDGYTKQDIKKIRKLAEEIQGGEYAHRVKDAELLLKVRGYKLETIELR